MVKSKKTSTPTSIGGARVRGGTYPSKRSAKKYFAAGEKKALYQNKTMPKPKGAVKKYKPRKAAPLKGFLKGKIDRNPVTHHEKRVANQLQKHGENWSRQRYTDWKSRRTNQNTTSVGGRGVRGLSSKTIGPLGLGFSISFDKSEVKKIMKEHIPLVAELATRITMRNAISAGYNTASLKLSLAYHLGGKRKNKKVDGDVFDILKGSLAYYELHETKTRYWRNVAGSYDDSDDVIEPTGLKGYHEGKTVNLSEMYEEGSGTFPYSSKLLVLWSTQGARRSRGENYVAYLKAPDRHPGFPRVQFMNAWYDTVMFELSQRAFNITLQESTQDILAKMGNIGSE